MEECDLLIDIIQQRREIIGSKIKEGKVRGGALGRRSGAFLSTVGFSDERNVCFIFLSGDAVMQAAGWGSHAVSEITRSSPTLMC